MHNLGMNIGDKRTLYAEIYRTLEPGESGFIAEVFKDSSDAHCVKGGMPAKRVPPPT